VLEKDLTEKSSDSCPLETTQVDKEPVLKLLQTNKGFILKNNHVLTYSTSKEGLKNFYCKRVLLDDGVSTTYLKI
jgi:hypothetical protein